MDTTALVNVALSRIGVSKQLVDVSTDASEEAYSSRLHWGLDVARVLREHPWPFATRYSNLTLVGGTSTVPVNQDWQYSYRAPTNMIYARRLVPLDGSRRAYNEDPIKFRVGADAIARLIYCDEEATDDAPLQLEYTIRVDCPAAAADPLFRSALAWLHAESLVSSLARDPKLVAYCEARYQMEIRKAAAISENEAQREKGGDAPWINARQ